jgi:hypothetical protein
MSIVKFIGFYPPIGYDSRDKINTIMPWDTGKASFHNRPYPIANTVTTDQTDIITKLQNIQFSAKKIDYMGSSSCRICKGLNGGSEYAIAGFVWPSGYIHYLRDHNVQIEEEFKKFILDFNPEESHDITFNYQYIC